jgi:predicted transcriptional regulator
MERTMDMPRKKPFDWSALTKEQFNEEIQKGLDDIKNGRVVSAEEMNEKWQRKCLSFV